MVIVVGNGRVASHPSHLSVGPNDYFHPSYHEMYLRQHDVLVTSSSSTIDSRARMFPAHRSNVSHAVSCRSSRFLLFPISPNPKRSMAHEFWLAGAVHSTQKVK